MEVSEMKIDTNSLVSITEANQNFSKVARLVDEKGAAVILKNNAPRYLVLEFGRLEQAAAPDEDVMEVSRKILAKHRKAFEELAK
jgi:antitoxin Phd